MEVIKIEKCLISREVKIVIFLDRREYTTSNIVAITTRRDLIQIYIFDKIELLLFIT
jgi:hypothetical protein